MQENKKGLEAALAWLREKEPNFLQGIVDQHWIEVALLQTEFFKSAR